MARPPIRKTVRKKLLIISVCDLTGKLEDVLDKLNRIVTSHLKHFDFELECDPGYDGGPDELMVYGYRDETDKELNNRIARERRAREKKKEEKEEREKVEKDKLKALAEKYPDMVKNL